MAADGELCVAIGNDAMFQRFCAAIGHPELAEDERFATNPQRVTHRAELDAALEAILIEAPVADWVRRLMEHGVPAGPVNDIAQAFAYAESLGVAPVDETDGVRTVRPAVGLSATPASVRRPPPGHGAHDDELRAWLTADQ
jgi:crotonobetainyl-CoA:carnitine CoA-transferase CaiB-like acyl-CoA transferase